MYILKIKIKPKGSSILYSSIFLSNYIDYLPNTERWALSSAALIDAACFWAAAIIEVSRKSRFWKESLNHVCIVFCLILGHDITNFCSWISFWPFVNPLRMTLIRLMIRIGKLSADCNHVITTRLDKKDRQKLWQGNHWVGENISSGLFLVCRKT